MEFMKHLFSSEGFMPHGYCLLWKQNLVWLHVLSDSIITLAYYSIPITLVYLARKRRDLAFQWMFLMFGAFILGCGTTHLMGILTLWIPSYWLDGGIKLATAVSSIVTAALLIPIVPKILAMRSPAELEAINLELERQIAERKQAEEEFRKVQERFSGIYNSSKDAIRYATVEGTLLDFNDSFARLTGYSREELLNGRRYQDITPQEYYEYESKMLEKMLRTGEAVEYEKEYIRKDGSRVPVLLTVFIVKGTDGEPIGNAAIIKDITERRQSEEELRTLNAITQAVHKSFDLEETYRFALDNVINLKNIDIAAIYLVDWDRKEAVLQAQRNLSEDYIKKAERIPYPKGLTWKVINTGQIVNIEDIQKDPSVGSAGRDLGHHSVLGIPITLEGRVIGVLYFASYKERQFNKQEIELLTSIGNQIAIAIAKAKLYRELTKKNRYETIISTVTQSVHKSINLQDVLENAVEAMSRNIDGIDSVSIFLVEGQEVVLQAYRGFPEWFVKRLTRIPYPKGATWKAVMEGKPIYCTDVDRDTVIGPAGRKLGIKSYICMPIHFRDKTVGVININSFQKNAFNEEDLGLLEIVTQQIEVAINNAQQAEAVRESREMFEKLYESAPDAIVVVNSEGCITRVNRQTEKMFGYGRNELIGQSVETLLPERFRQRHIGHRITYFSEPRQRAMGAGLELYGKHKDGIEFPVDVMLSPMETVESTLVLSVIRDTTERKRMEEMLLKSRNFYLKLFDEFPTLVWKSGIDTKCDYFNRSWLEFTGRTMDQETGDGWTEGVHPEDLERCVETYLDAFNKREPFRMEYRLRRYDGEYRWIVDFGRPFYNLEGEFAGYVGSCYDITERKQAEKALARYTEELAHSNTELEQFASVASHDLQEPLRKILAFGDRLKVKYGELIGDEGRDYLERMENASRRMQTLINDLLTLSKITAKPDPFIPVNLTDVVQQVLSDLEIRIQQTGGRIEMDNLPTIDADPTQMRLLMQNLIGNALKYHREEEAPVIRINSKPLNGQEEEWAGNTSGNRLYQIIVEDNGIGFDEKYLDRIFLPFQRLHPRSQYEGTGIGLAICRRIAERHGGSITAKSTPGQGSTFIVTLPIKHPNK